MISLVVNSHNEGEKLLKCLSSVHDLVDEMIVIDMESTDNTVEVAQKFGAKIFKHPKVDYIEPVRQFAVDQAKHEWILVLDPDEQLPGSLKVKLQEIAKQNNCDAVNIPRLNIFFSKKIKHTNFWPDRQIRFFKKGKLTFSNIIHSYPKVDGEVLTLPASESLAIEHNSYQTISEYWNRMKRYAKIEARNRYDQGERFSVIRMFYLALYDFTRRYIRHLGVLDGWVGLELSVMQAYYYFLLEINLRQLQSK